MIRILRKILVTGLILAMGGITLSSCSGKSDEPLPTPTDAYNPPYPHNPAKAKRTVLVYMIADNSLGSQGWDAEDMKEMKQAVSEHGFNGCRLLIYHAPAGEEASLKEITADGTEVLKKYQYNTDVYSVDKERMSQVMADMHGFAPADDYGLVLWSHGSGWKSTNSSRSVPRRSFGDDRSKTMKITSLAEVLDGERFSFIYFDCCNMANIETVYQLRNASPVIVASATELPCPGMDYSVNVPVFFADEPDMVAAARNTFEYYDAQTGMMHSCTMSVIDTRRLQPLVEATRAIMEVGAPNPTLDMVQPFMKMDCTVFDFADYISKIDCDPSLKDSWNEALASVVVYAAATPSIILDPPTLPIKAHCGLGSWILTSPSDGSRYGYNTLDWWTDVVSHNPLYNPLQ